MFITQKGSPNLRKVGRLGKGAYGIVFLVRSPLGKNYAAKAVRLRETKEYRKQQRKIERERKKENIPSGKSVRYMSSPSKISTKKDVWLEVYCQAKSKHANIVMVYDVICKKDFYYIISELCSCAVDDIAIEEKGDWDGVRLPLEIILHIIAPITEAISYMHSVRIVHRDIKPGNILLTKAGVPKLTDFGLATPKNLLKSSGIFGTPEFTAPEFYLNKEITEKVDVYSLAITMLAMAESTPTDVLTINYVYKNYDKCWAEGKDLQGYFWSSFTLEKKISEESKHTVLNSFVFLQKAMLILKPEDRISAQAVCNWPVIRLNIESWEYKNELYRTNNVKLLGLMDYYGYEVIWDDEEKRGCSSIFSWFTC